MVTLEIIFKEISITMTLLSGNRQPFKQQLQQQQGHCQQQKKTKWRLRYKEKMKDAKKTNLKIFHVKERSGRAPMRSHGVTIITQTIKQLLESSYEKVMMWKSLFRDI